MKKLLAIELNKLMKLSTMRVILLVYFALSPLLAYGFYYLLNKFVGPLLGPDWNPFAAPEVWALVTYTSSWFNVLMGVIIVVVMTNEYNYKTLKQNVIDGMSVRQVIAGKFLIVFILSTIVTIYTVLMGIVFGFFNPGDVGVFDGFSKIPVYYLQTLCYFSFAFMFATLVKRSALSIIFFILSFFVESIIGAVLSFAKFEVIYAFFPLNAFSRLLPFPILRQSFEAANERSGETPFLLDDWVNILVCLFYMILFFMISLWVIKRRDL